MFLKILNTNSVKASCMLPLKMFRFSITSTDYKLDMLTLKKFRFAPVLKIKFLGN